LKGILFPLVARAFGLIASIVGIMIVKCDEKEDPMAALNRGYYVTSALAIVGFFFAARWMLAVDPAAHPGAESAWFYFFLCGVIGIAMAQAFVYITQYYTEYKYRPVKSIAEASQTGPATNIIAGIAVGLECTAIPVVVISVAIMASYYLGNLSGVPHAGLFGTAVATMGMLGTAAYILAMDTFGPITDNAGGIIEMSGQPEEAQNDQSRRWQWMALTRGMPSVSGSPAFLLRLHRRGRPLAPNESHIAAEVCSPGLALVFLLFRLCAARAAYT
jgi:K(+)-stimulated pyrophosphate-energized sodium pump